MSGLHCSFCGKSEAEVRHIVAGPSVYICDECVGLCVDVLRDEGIEVGTFIDVTPKEDHGGEKTQG